MLQKGMSPGDALEHVQPADRRRRPGLADPRAAAVRGDRPDRHPLDHRRRHGHATSPTSSPRSRARCASPAAPRIALCAASPACPSCRSCSSARAVLLVAPARVGRRPRRPPRRRGGRAAGAAPASRTRPTRCIERDAGRHRSSCVLAPDLVDLVDTGAAATCSTGCARCAARWRCELGIVMPARAHPRQPRPAARPATRSGSAASRSAAARRRPATCWRSATAWTRCPAAPTTEPVFGLAGKWVPAELRQQAELSGATVVDRAVGDHHPPGRGRRRPRRRGCSAARTSGARRDASSAPTRWSSRS